MLVFYPLLKINGIDHLKALQPVGVIILVRQVHQVINAVKVPAGGAVQTDDTSDFQDVVVCPVYGKLRIDTDFKETF